MRRYRPLSVLLVVLALTPACKQGTAMLNLYGFTALKPPSNLYQAGAIVSVDDRDTGGSLKLICGPRASLGEDWVPQESQTITTSVRGSQKATWHLEGDVLDKVKAEQDLCEVEDIEMTLENARIVEMQDIDVWANVANRSEPCVQAVKARLKAGYKLTMISSNIVADVTYRVTFKRDAKLTKEARYTKMKELAVRMGGGYTAISETSVHAVNLAVGIKTDSFLLHISVPREYQPVLDGNNRNLHMTEADTDSTPDAPVVPPRGHPIQPTRKPKGYDPFGD